MRLAAHRLEVDLPDGYDARIYRREPHLAEATTSPVLHAATFALPEDRGDFGSGAVEVMRSADVFVCLREFDAEAAGTALFARRGVPLPLRAADFSPDRLQRAIPGQAGTQFFFSLGQRAFCLYVVLGSAARRTALVAVANDLVARLRVDGVPVSG